MEHLLEAWPDVVRQIKRARHILLLADFDGTLTPIVERPELANLDPGVRRVLERLARQRRVTVGIVSGRALSDLKERVRVPGIVYAGNHGLEIEGPGLSFINPIAREIRPVLRVIRGLIERALGATRGVLVEDKGLSLSVHYRQVPPGQTEKVKTAVERAVTGAVSSGKVRLTEGKKVFEVRPAVAEDKGKAVELVIKRSGRKGQGVLPIYLGDDLTDEDAFRAIERGQKGLSVYVGDGNQSTAARYVLKSPAEVADFLARLSSELGGKTR